MMIGAFNSPRTAEIRVVAAVGAVLLLCSAGSLGAQESRPEPSPTANIPERYSRQVAPSPSTYWRSPALGDYTRVLKSTEAPLIDQNKRYELAELIDLAQRTNPETRVAWEAARRAALAVGLVESEYFPVLAISALGGYRSVGVPIPQNLVSDGFFRFDLAQVVPTLNLRWLLLDFGRRGSAWDAAKERLLAANLGFNRKHQQIAFGVQRAFYGLTSIRARIAVAQRSLDAARSVEEATESRLRNGLATRPELARARQQAAQATFELQEVLDRERDAQVTLVEGIGVSPTAPIQVTEFSALPPPAALQGSVEQTIDAQSVFLVLLAIARNAASFTARAPDIVRRATIRVDEDAAAILEELAARIQPGGVASASQASGVRAAFERSVAAQFDAVGADAAGAGTLGLYRELAVAVNRLAQCSPGAELRTAVQEIGQ
jgi:outer membrane protein TolC